MTYAVDLQTVIFMLEMLGINDKKDIQQENQMYCDMRAESQSSAARRNSRC
jgi:hypothetical protein